MARLDGGLFGGDNTFSVCSWSSHTATGSISAIQRSTMIEWCNNTPSQTQPLNATNNSVLSLAR